MWSKSIEIKDFSFFNSIQNVNKDVSKAEQLI